MILVQTNAVGRLGRIERKGRAMKSSNSFWRAWVRRSRHRVFALLGLLAVPTGIAIIRGLILTGDLASVSDAFRRARAATIVVLVVALPICCYGIYIDYRLLTAERARQDGSA